MNDIRKGRTARPFFVSAMTRRLRSDRSIYLSARERLSVSVSALYALGRKEGALRELRRFAPALTSRDKILLRELFIHLSLLLGFPAMLDGLEQLASLGMLPANTGTTSTTGRGLNRRGRRILTKIYGTQTRKLLSGLRSLNADLPTMIIEQVYGAVFTRRGMSLAERELVNITVLVIQGFDRQLYSHLRGALRVGISGSRLRRVLQLLNSRFNVDVRRAQDLLSGLLRSSGNN
jgi:alkylhydroperoxidase/carboxymuconolactone decarboxylase family protein YurZ